MVGPASAAYQTPDKSGRTVRVRGVRAVRLGAPFFVLGVPGVGYWTHCAHATSCTGHRNISDAGAAQQSVSKMMIEEATDRHMAPYNYPIRIPRKTPNAIECKAGYIIL